MDFLGLTQLTLALRDVLLCTRTGVMSAFELLVSSQCL
jgi:hypothetical protein